MALKISSFNCFSIRKRIEIVRDLLRENDIVLLQEILLSSDTLDFATNIDSSFYCAHVPSFDPCLHGLNGRLRGGLSVYWNKKLNNIVRPLYFSDCMIGLTISIGNVNYLLINVYMPCDDRTYDSLLKYKNSCADLLAIIETEREKVSIHKVIVVGDFNADPTKGRFWPELESFIAESGMFVTDVDLLPFDSYTYLSSFNSTSWLDHVVVSDRDIVDHLQILYGQTFYDHIPISFELKIPMGTEFNIINNRSLDVNNFIIWDKLSRAERKDYNLNVEVSLGGYLNRALLCSDSNCKSDMHRSLLDDAYAHLVNTLHSASECYTVRCRNRTFHQVPGWNDFCKTKYNVARNYFLNWNSGGRLRSGSVYESMKSSRKIFKEALAKCKRDQNIIKNQKLASSFALKNKCSFWKSVDKLKSRNTISSTIIDNIVEPVKILNIFNDKFKSVFDDKKSQSCNFDFTTKLKKLNNNLVGAKFRIYDFHVSAAISSINDCIGIEGLHSNHFKVAVDSIKGFLSRLFSSFLSHGYMPVRMLLGEIRPIVKNKLGNLSDSNNYRPIMISTNCLKLFEYCILGHLECSFLLNFHQFGFRKYTSTLMATAVLKETIKSYNMKGSKVYAAFLDLSKAFDKINHNILMSKLIDSNVSPVVVNTLLYMYGNQFVNVSFNGEVSRPWLIRNGVRQGGIISPFLFNLYINGVLDQINNCNVGCKLGIIRHNCQAYADDLTLLSPSSNGLQFLIDRIFRLLTDIDLTLNIDKSVFMIFKPNSKIDRGPVPIFKLKGNVMLNVSSCKYLGIIITDDLCNKSDILRCETSFLRQFYSIYRRFYYADMSVLIYLFKSHCLSLFGCELWYNLKGCITTSKCHAINYHKCIKKILGVSWMENNHDICEFANLHTFRHLVNWKMISFAFNLINTKSVCFNRYVLFYKFFRHLCKDERHFL